MLRFSTRSLSPSLFIYIKGFLQILFIDIILFNLDALCSFLNYNWAIILTSAESTPRSGGQSSGDDWRSAFDAANGAQNGDAGSRSRRTPSRLPPAPPGSGFRS